MSNFQQLLPDTITIFTVSLKTFSNLYQIKNYKTAKNMYADYLDLSNKKPHMKLTSVDIYKLDGIIL